MEKVVLPETKGIQSLRRRKNGMSDNDQTEVSDAFMQIIDNMLMNMQMNTPMQTNLQQNLFSALAQNTDANADNAVGAVSMDANMLTVIGNMLNSKNAQIPQEFTDLLNSLNNSDGSQQQDVTSQLEQMIAGLTEQQGAVTIPVTGIQPQVASTATVVNQLITNSVETDEVAQTTQDTAQSKQSSENSFVIENVPVVEAKYTDGTEEAVGFKGITVPTIIQNKVNVQTKPEVDNDTVKQETDSQKTENKETLNQVEGNGAQTVFKVEQPEIKQVEPVVKQDFEIVKQINDGIKENLNTGKSEFVLKLKPQELGEITFKIAEKAGKMVLDITTASASTAKMINLDLASLRDVVRPLNVEVNEVTVHVPETAQGNATHFDMAGNQQFENHQNAYTNQNSNYRSQHSFFSEDDSYMNQSALASDGLDTYV